ncbi:hypothetical protein B0O99DRAFT_647356 [Bisporella sp. PMI_857]|nr:hypothetical protein B0O99DRAFT_647356 [Bisporella sp. PMI_857]
MVILVRNFVACYIWCAFSASFAFCGLGIPIFTLAVSSKLESRSILAIEATPRNVAAITEDSPLMKLAPFLLHFSSVLGPAWSVVHFTTL